jgi:amino acid transporter
MNREGLDPDLQPSIALIANSIPRRYAILILVFVLLSFLFQTCAQLLATSRYIWSLARESALPFSTFFRGLSKRHRQPSAAIWVTVGIAAPTLLLLSINTSIIATTLLEGAGITATSAYVAPILLYLFCPNDVLRGDGRAQFTLRKASKPLAVGAVVFLLTFIITMCLPTGYPITPRASFFPSFLSLL